ncbi:MAG: hypothetical protein A3F67_11835 [Verrucomicrobia bacterium RIFCSPHIGHO2_12_FULL_41_10]|nr:MAG: hypothetical protein A3F67_11835 [Verrucomicrobia bacterium RIFCSPHIGHO2_12_FULL_41_10]
MNDEIISVSGNDIHYAIIEFEKTIKGLEERYSAEIDRRIMAIVKTNLEQAELWSLKLFQK